MKFRRNVAGSRKSRKKRTKRRIGHNKRMEEKIVAQEITFRIREKIVLVLVRLLSGVNIS